MALNENAEAWVLALESGEYKQGVGNLATKVEGGVEYCCLGVACDLAAKAGVTVVKDRGRRIAFGYSGVENGSYAAALPPEVRRWLGLANRFGDMPGDVGLTSRNDRGDSFADIAGHIRREPDGLFGKLRD